MAQSKLEKFFAQKDKKKGEIVPTVKEEKKAQLETNIFEFPSLCVSKTSGCNIGADDRVLSTTLMEKTCIIRTKLTIVHLVKVLERFCESEGIERDDIIVFPLVDKYESIVLQKFSSTLMSQVTERAYIIVFKQRRNTLSVCSYVHKNILAKEIPIQVRMFLLENGKMEIDEIDKMIGRYLYTSEHRNCEPIGSKWITKGLDGKGENPSCWADEADEENKIRTLLVRDDPFIPRLSFYKKHMKAERLKIKVSEIHIKSFEVSGDSKDYRYFVDDEEFKYGEIRRGTKTIDIIAPIYPQSYKSISECWELIILISLLGNEVTIITETGRRDINSFYLEVMVD